MMVALAEDKTYQREIWEKYCQQLNYTILFSVCNGIEAIEWLTNNSNTLPDILVTDIDMPHMDGASLCKYCTTHYKSIKVLAASLHSTRQPVESMFKAGAMGFLPKTLMKLYLKNAVESLANNEVFIYDPGILTNDDINYLKFIRDPRCRKCV